MDNRPLPGRICYRGLAWDVGRLGIDTTGLGALIDGYQATRETGCAFLVINPTAGFRRVLTVTGLCDLFGLGEPDASFASAAATGA